MKNLLLLFICIVCVSSCVDNVIEETQEEDLGYQFYPLSVGNEWIYQVDTSIIAGNGVVHTSSQLKESIIELISEDQSSKVYKVERSYRRTEQDAWSVTDIWTVELTSGQVIRTEENQKFIKLVFPNKLRTSWDGNTFFDDRVAYYSGADAIDNFYLDWKYRVTLVDTTLFLDSQSYEGVTEVTHVFDIGEGGVDRRISREYFAPSVGLVRKDLSAFYSGTGAGFGEDEDWLLVADKGMSYRQQLISYTIK